MYEDKHRYMRKRTDVRANKKKDVEEIDKYIWKQSIRHMTHEGKHRSMRGKTDICRER